MSAQWQTNFYQPPGYSARGYSGYSGYPGSYPTYTQQGTQQGGYNPYSRPTYYPTQQANQTSQTVIPQYTQPTVTERVPEQQHATSTAELPRETAVKPAPQKTAETPRYETWEELTQGDDQFSTQQKKTLDAPDSPNVQKPLTYAEEMGEKVGQAVTKLLNEKPELQHKLDQMDVEKVLDDPYYYLNRVRDEYQNSKSLQFLTHQVINPMVKILPDNMEPMVHEGIAWLDGKPLNTNAASGSVSGTVSGQGTMRPLATAAFSARA